MIRPDHYKSGSIECWDVMKIMFGEDPLYWFCILNAFKYLWRYKEKDGKRDLEKAVTYLEKAAESGYLRDPRDPDWVERLYNIIGEKLCEYKEEE